MYWGNVVGMVNPAIREIMKDDTTTIFIIDFGSRPATGSIFTKKKDIEWRH